MMFLRQLIFDTAAVTEGVGEIEETLKWGEPSYLTRQSKSGSTIRIDWKPLQHCYALYFNCKTDLVDTFKELYGPLFKYSGNRSILLEETRDFPIEELSHCIYLALTYHKRKRFKR